MAELVACVEKCVCRPSLRNWKGKLFNIFSKILPLGSEETLE
jgi:hypothetical protein